MQITKHFLYRLILLATVVGLIVGNLNTVALATVTAKRAVTPTPNIIIKGADSSDDSKAIPNAKINLTSTTDTQKSYLLTSDDEGLFNTIIDNQTGLKVNHVDIGEYVISSVENPIGYRLVGDSLGMKVQVSEKQSKIIIYYTEVAEGTITLNAKTVDGTPIPGVVFTATEKDSKVVHQFSPTDANGMTKLRLPAQNYNIGVQAAPAGYTAAEALPFEQLGSNMSIDEDIQFDYQQPVGNIEVKVTDADTQAQLAGVTVAIASVKTPSQKMTATTDAKGIAHWSDLAVGQYKLTVEKMLPHYVVTGQSEQLVNVNHGETAQLTLTARQQAGTFHIHSISESGRKIPNVSYQVTALDGRQQQTVQTNEAGMVILTGLNEGQYTVKEIKVPAGYQLLNQAEQTISVRNGQIPDVTFVHQISRTDADHDLVIKTADHLGKAVGNVQFQVRQIDTDEEPFSQNVTVDADGQARLSSIPIGKYEVTQKTTPAGYQGVQTQQTFTVSNQHPNQIDWLFNREVSAIRLAVTNDVTGAPIKGASFIIQTTNPNDQGQRTFFTDQTDANGQVELQNLPTGSFTYQQVATAPGYVMDSTIHTGVIQNTGISANQFAITNQMNPPAAKGQVTVHKLNAQGQPLTGAQFKLTKADGSETQTKTTEKGQLIFADLTPGRYLITETKAPAGYVLDQTPQTVEVNNQARINQVVTFNDQREVVAPTNPLTLNALDQHGNGIAGATFKLSTKLPDDQGQTTWYLTTDKNGLAILPKAVTGQYHIQMVKVPSGYQLNTTVYTMAVEQYGHNHLNIVSETTPDELQTLQIQKTDTQGQPLAGAVFDVASVATGKVVQAESNAKGLAKVNNLKAGDYEVTEVKAPIGYRLDAQGHQVHLKKAQPITNITIQNVAQTGQLTINKTAESGQPLAGASFDVRNQQGALVGNYQTNAKGQIKLTNIAVGDYTVQETKAPNGYQVNAKTFKATISDRHTTTVKVVDQKVTPEVAPGVLVIHNVDQKKQTPLVGATFRLETADGKVVRQQLVIGAAGQVVVDGLTAGDYQLIQTTAATAYQTTATPITVKVQGNHEVTAITVENHQAAGSVIVNQVDGNTNQPLVGAKYQVQSSTGKVLIDNLKSDERGHVIIQKLMPATYRLVEVSAPTGYDTIKTPIIFKITENGVTKVIQ